MAKDQMQDVFAINFDWKKGERPTSSKLTGWVKQTDSAFSDITQAIGDPWEYYGLPLSPEKLTQTSFARTIGPNDWLSPQGSSWGETCTAAISLQADRNTWSLGYPLVKTLSELTPESEIDSVVSLTFDPTDLSTDISDLSDDSNVFVTEVDFVELVNSAGKYHVDYHAGVITSFSIPSNPITFNVNNFCMFGPGVPWGSNNVIPTWKQETLCTLSIQSSPAGGESTYTLDFPIVEKGTRSTGSLSGSEGVDYPSNTVPGAGATYRVPYSLSANYNELDEIPDGYALVWDEVLGRIIPSITILYKDKYSVTLKTVEGALDSYLGGNKLRLILPGTSIAEAVNYLMYSSRSNKHEGLTAGQDGKTLAFNNPIAHSDLAERFNGILISNDANLSVENLKFTESTYSTNDHPQYIHRAGFMQNDIDGNTGNAMRGDIVFASVDNRVDDIGLLSDSNGIKFGSYLDEAAYINLYGTINSTNPIPFGRSDIGISRSAGVTYGALTIKSYGDMPLYLKSDNSDVLNSGTSIAFDYLDNNEMNYVKMMGNAVASNVYNMPARVSASVSWGTPLPVCGSNIEKRISYDQLREWRFRGVPKVSSAINSGLEDSGDLEKVFTSPGIVGADFLNVYSNAIFFSKSGDGSRTALHDNWQWFYNSTVDRPIGLYYEPAIDNGHGRYSLYAGESDGGTEVTAYFGANSALINPSKNSGEIKIYEDGWQDKVELYNYESYISVSSGTPPVSGAVKQSTINIVSKDYFYLEAEDSAIKMLTGTYEIETIADQSVLSIWSGNSIEMAAVGNFNLDGSTISIGTGYSGFGLPSVTKASYVWMEASTQVDIRSANQITIHASDGGQDYLALLCGESLVTTPSSVGNDDIYIEAEKNIYISSKALFINKSSGLHNIIQIEDLPLYSDLQTHYAPDPVPTGVLFRSSITGNQDIRITGL